MNVTAIIEKGTDGTYDVYTTESTLNYMVLGQGKTVELAIEDFFNTYNEIKQAFAEENKDFTEIENFNFRYDLPSFLQHYSKYFSYAAMGRLTGINETQLSQYVQGYRKPGVKTAEKIEKSLHQLGKELQQLQFV
jgi:transcriptional regulator with XRE-family HTH domain